jgi:hypothetical protein
MKGRNDTGSPGLPDVIKTDRIVGAKPSPGLFKLSY